MSKEKSAALAAKAGREASFAAMSDPFALLGLPRRPWLDESIIRAAFHERARRSHPDAQDGDGAIFAALNAAHASLANPAARLRLLAGDTPPSAMPADFQLGFRVAEVLRKVKTLCASERAAANVLARALVAKDAPSVRKDLDALIVTLDAFRAALDSRLRLLDERWPDVPAAKLAALAGEYTFLSRWQGQAREARLAQEIAFGKSDGNDGALPSNGGNRTVGSDFSVGRKRPAHFPAVDAFNRATAVMVTCCTKHRKPLLARAEIHELLRRVWLEAGAWQVGHYVLMPDHLHFFAVPGFREAPSLARWVSYWKSLASRQWPHPHEQPVWQADFWDTQLRNAGHYSEKWEYIRGNPVRHGLCAEAGDWPFQGEIHALGWHD